MQITRETRSTYVPLRLEYPPPFFARTLYRDNCELLSDKYAENGRTILSRSGRSVQFRNLQSAAAGK